MKKIVAVVKEPGGAAKIKTIDNTLKSFQEIVGGYIECIPFPGIEELDIFLNEEGKLIGLNPNIYLREYKDIIVGTFFVVGNDGEGDAISLTEEQIEKVREYIEENWY